VPPFVTLVGLFVNETKLTVRRVMEAVPIQLLQFHGDEDESFCRSFGALHQGGAGEAGPRFGKIRGVLSFRVRAAAGCHVEGYGGRGRWMSAAGWKRQGNQGRAKIAGWSEAFDLPDTAAASSSPRP
jgi:hypothetical protein